MFTGVSMFVGVGLTKGGITHSTLTKCNYNMRRPMIKQFGT